MPAWPEPAWAERAYKIAGTVVGIGLGAMSALLEVMASPMHMTLGHTLVRVPLATLFAIVGNIALVWGTKLVTGKASLALLPGFAWFLVMLAASTRTSEGDLLITSDNWVGLTAILCGAAAWVGSGYVLAYRRARARAAETDAAKR